jgi:hypothetical protein
MYSAKALLTPISDLLETAENLDAKLQEWHASIPEVARLRATAKEKRDSGMDGVPYLQSVALEFFYHYATCAIHRRFPAQTFWHRKTQPTQDDSTAARMAENAKKCLESSRMICLLTSNLEIHAYNPSWCVASLFEHIANMLIRSTKAAHLLPSQQHDDALHERGGGPTSSDG